MKPEPKFSVAASLAEIQALQAATGLPLAFPTDPLTYEHESERLHGDTN
jgi:hypothetical protein